MSSTLVARKDFEDVIRSGMLWAVVGVSVLFLAIIFFGVTTGSTDEAGQGVIYVLINSVGAQILIPLIALIFCYLAVAGERESGSLRVLFGLTHSRRDVLLGKLYSRTAVMAATGLVLSLVVAGLITLQFDSLNVGEFLAFLGLTELLILSFTGIAIGVSALSGSRLRAMAGAIGSYVVFFMLWYPATAMIHLAVEGELAGIEAPDWYLFALMLNPLNTYRFTLGDHTDQYLGTFVGWPSVVEDIPSQQFNADPTVMLVSNRAPDGVFYTSDWFAVLVFVFWFVLPVVIGYWRFERADLG